MIADRLVGESMMGDGAVRFISEKIDTVTRQRLSTMADNQVIGEF